MPSADRTDPSAGVARLPVRSDRARIRRTGGRVGAGPGWLYTGEASRYGRRRPRRIGPPEGTTRRRIRPADKNVRAGMIAEFGRHMPGGARATAAIRPVRTASGMGARRRPCTLEADEPSHGPEMAAGAHAPQFLMSDSRVEHVEHVEHGRPIDRSPAPCSAVCDVRFSCGA
jgi:hypothetical protein